jgi:glutathione S-transferase
MEALILHHYDASPFSEKVRVAFGIKGLAWASMIEPVIMPKPELVALTGGYRRIPVLQAGADIYCDTQAILAELDRRAEPRLVRGGDWAVNIWADRLFFQASVAVVFAAIGHTVPAAFIADREQLSGRPFDFTAMKATETPMRAQWRAHAAWIEAGLQSGQPFLGGAAPALADVAAYMNVWWLTGAAPPVAGELLAGLAGVEAWRERMRRLGHGERREIGHQEALDVARQAEPGPPPPHEPDPLGLAPGAAVSVRADDYGRDPVAGRLVALTRDRVVIARETPEIGRLHLHFPRIGYEIAGG